jgi:hypothetical protein
VDASVTFFAIVHPKDVNGSHGMGLREFTVAVFRQFSQVERYLMKSLCSALLGLVVVFVVCVVVGCGSGASGDKMSGDKMGMESKMMSDKMDDGKMDDGKMDDQK